MTLFPELECLTLDSLTTRFLSGPPCDEDSADRDLWLQEVAARIAQCGEKGLSFLIRSMPGANQAKLRAILLSFSFLPKTLTKQSLDDVKQILKSFLHSDDPMLIAQAIDSLRLLGFADFLDDVLALLVHKSPYVTGSVLRYVSWHSPERAKPMLLESLNSTDALVRQNAIDELDDLGFVDALPYVRPFLNDEDKYVRQAAQTAVANLEQAREGEGNR
jgi:hypothetical protein